MANEKAELLPLAEVDEVQWLVDINSRELRQFDNPNHVMRMHSLQGRQIVGTFLTTGGRQHSSPWLFGCTLDRVNML